VATRAEAKPHLFPLAASPHERAWLLTEDHSASNTHDLRLVTNEVIGPGLYRLRFLMRSAARSHAVVQIHSRWEHSALFHVDLHSAQIAGLEIKGTLLEFVDPPTCIRVDDNWTGGTCILRIVDFLDGCGVVVYAADGKDYKYTGDGRDSLAIGLLDLTRI
jgi:hypothetical protein